MAVHIIRHEGVCHVGTVRYWAERGLIHAEDSRDNSYLTIPVKEMLLRVQALNQMRPGIDGTEDKITKAWVYEQRAAIQKNVDEMVDVIRKAQEQGMPDDPTATGALKAARPVTMVMPQEVELRGKGKGQIGIFADFN